MTRLMQPAAAPAAASRAMRRPSRTPLLPLPPPPPSSSPLGTCMGEGSAVNVRELFHL
jgi:hypothetical protein